jgi:hypothetical protein
MDTPAQEERQKICLSSIILFYLGITQTGGHSLMGMDSIPKSIDSNAYLFWE